MNNRVVRPRVCPTCRSVIETDAAGMRAHGEGCAAPPAEDPNGPVACAREGRAFVATNVRGAALLGAVAAVAAAGPRGRKKVRR